MGKLHFNVGDKVAAGTGDDRDTGTIFGFRERDDGQEEADIGWDSGVRTWCDVWQLEEVD
jgi:hypothetical protein